jgi:hypothetical protein
VVPSLSSRPRHGDLRRGSLRRRPWRARPPSTCPTGSPRANVYPWEGVEIR